MMKTVVCFAVFLLLAVPSLQQTPDEICHLNAEPGMCRGYFPRYYYNANAHHCETFIYGGCGANANNFVNVADCEQMCHSV